MSLNKYTLNIRFSVPSDWERIIEIYNQSVLEKGKTADTDPQTVSGRIEWFNQHLDKKHPILLAEVDDKIVGWCSLSPHRPGRKALELTAEISYYVDVTCRGNGVGAFLIESAINIAKTNGIKNVFALLLDINSISVSILERFGFKKWGHLPNVAKIDNQICGQYIYGKHI